mmetsp:Transcript_14926/g.24946  ORF Transcript_14926/g.24946 Transcript_14926/m.24946 type:complete len:320 (-) Transcript_14926:49-1008(-)
MLVVAIASATGLENSALRQLQKLNRDILTSNGGANAAFSIDPRAMQENYGIMQYQRNGFTFPLQLIARPHFEALLDMLPLREIASRGIGDSSLLDSHLPSQWAPPVWQASLHTAAIRSPQLTRAVSAALEWEIGPNVRDIEPLLLSTDIFCKPAHDTKFVGWHQDQSWWSLLPRNGLVNVWTSIDGTDADHACVKMVPGSHRAGDEPNDVLPHDSDVPGNVLKYSVDESRATGNSSTTAVCARLDVGQSVLFSGLLVHGSQPNHSDRTRCGIVMRFANSDFAFDPAAPHKMLSDGTLYTPYPMRLEPLRVVGSRKNITL